MPWLQTHDSCQTDSEMHCQDFSIDTGLGPVMINSDRPVLVGLDSLYRFTTAAPITPYRFCSGVLLCLIGILWF
ncbi:Uncharacterised protein [Mycobacteroides abscessus]|nr:Uncharacterised protein [Mycobacteroides abscessus]SKK68256.1 Uncharacterised protein [Mycobacteroides abscessus subsp. massiliense]CPU58203.1 Uncharacterised protein [Mycobacteroides abscessus]SKP93450.1 Uncharacterised protein [Mycobacteroides abscessus subsp. massiliense]SKV59820.1 Uncharacterised protein [Mycobacteroides abscessus subsp. massiliense]